MEVTAPAAVVVTSAAEATGSYQAPLPPPPAAAAPNPRPAVAAAEPAPAPPPPPPGAAVVPPTAPAVAAAVLGPPPVGTASTAGAVVVSPGPGSGGTPGGVMKKKRGRPRKYGPDGSVLKPLNPTPISASVPAGEYPVTAAAIAAYAMKRGRARPGGYVSKQQQRQQRTESESLGDMVACSSGANFTPHILTVAAGEDVTTKIISFAQQGPRAICILSANGSISNVTLRQPDSSGGTLTYEGRFELLSLSGSFMPTDNGGTRSRSGGMSVSLASPDGRVVGGGVAGQLVGAGPVQVVVGSFLPSYQMEQKTKKPKLETGPVSTVTAAIPISSAELVGTYGGGQGQHNSVTPKPNHANSSSFRGENWVASIHSVVDTRNTTNDINMSVSGG